MFISCMPCYGLYPNIDSCTTATIVELRRSHTFFKFDSNFPRTSGQRKMQCLGDRLNLFVIPLTPVPMLRYSRLGESAKMLARILELVEHEISDRWKVADTEDSFPGFIFEAREVERIILEMRSKGNEVTAVSLLSHVGKRGSFERLSYSSSPWQGWITTVFTITWYSGWSPRA